MWYTVEKLRLLFPRVGLPLKYFWNTHFWPKSEYDNIASFLELKLI